MTAAAQPRDRDLQAARAAWQAGRAEEAQRICERLAAGAADAEALGLLAEMCQALGQREAALSALQRLARLRPADASAHRRLGNAYLDRQRPAESLKCYRRALELEPDNVRALNNLGRALLLLQRRVEARESFQKALALQPSHALAHLNLGAAHEQDGNLHAALDCYRRAAQLQEEFAQAHQSCANVLILLRRADEALIHSRRALALDPEAVEALLAEGRALQQLERYAEAAALYRASLARFPRSAALLSDCANALLALMRPEEALQCCDGAIALDPDLVEAHDNRAGALRALHRYQEAEEACGRSLRLRPDGAQAWSNLANVMLAMHCNERAIDCCRKAIALCPTLAEAHSQLAGALYVQKRHREALEVYEQLLALEPRRKFLASAVLGTRQACCDWRDFDSACEALRKTVRAVNGVVAPMTLLSICDEPALHLQAARAFAEDQLPVARRAEWPGTRYTHEKVRIAYLSADFHQHATAVLAAGLFEAHDRSAFEIIGISFGPDDGSAMRQRLIGAFDRFIDVTHISDDDVAQLLRTLEVDIAVDLKGYTGDCRPGILARRAAPIQVQYLGYPGTMALPQIDYIVADAVVLPEAQQHLYSEHIVWLPDSYQVNDDRRPIDARIPTRAEAGLPPGGFVFCCFNNNYKISPAMFDVWMHLLREVPGSILWLLADNPLAVSNLRGAATARGMAAERLVFAQRAAPPEHLARHRLADLFLDTLPYNAHTTASDALWAGLPVLTCAGGSFAARVGASLLRSVGLAELVTDDLQHYVQTALTLAREPARLSQLRERLCSTGRGAPLFDTARFCRHLEQAYRLMWELQRSGQSAQNLRVQPIPL